LVWLVTIPKTGIKSALTFGNPYCSPERHIQHVAFDLEAALGQYCRLFREKLLRFRQSHWRTLLLSVVSILPLCAKKPSREVDAILTPGFLQVAIAQLRFHCGTKFSVPITLH